MEENAEVNISKSYNLKSRLHCDSRSSRRYRRQVPTEKSLHSRHRRSSVTECFCA